MKKGYHEYLGTLVSGMKYDKINEDYEIQRVEKEATKWENKTKDLQNKIQYAKILSAAAQAKHETTLEKLKADFYAGQRTRENHLKDYKIQLAQL